MRFSQKVPGRFLNQKNLPKISMTQAFDFTSGVFLNCRFQVVNNAQSQITHKNNIFFNCNLTLSVIYDLKMAI
jgi:hypothetical protein